MHVYIVKKLSFKQLLNEMCGNGGSFEIWSATIHFLLSLAEVVWKVSSRIPEERARISVETWKRFCKEVITCVKSWKARVHCVGEPRHGLACMHRFSFALDHNGASKSSGFVPCCLFWMEQRCSNQRRGQSAPSVALAVGRETRERGRHGAEGLENREEETGGGLLLRRRIYL